MRSDGHGAPGRLRAGLLYRRISQLAARRRWRLLVPAPRAGRKRGGKMNRITHYLHFLSVLALINYGLRWRRSLWTHLRCNNEAFENRIDRPLLLLVVLL